MEREVLAVDSGVYQPNAIFLFNLLHNENGLFLLVC